MNVRELLRLRDGTLLTPQETPEFFASIYNAQWLFKGDDMISNENVKSFLVDNTGTQIQATNQFGFAQRNKLI